MICDICGNKEAKFTIKVYSNSKFVESYILCYKCKYFYMDKLRRNKNE